MAQRDIMEARIPVVGSCWERRRCYSRRRCWGYVREILMCIIWFYSSMRAFLVGWELYQWGKDVPKTRAMGVCNYTAWLTKMFQEQFSYGCRIELENVYIFLDQKCPIDFWSLEKMLVSATKPRNGNNPRKMFLQSPENIFSNCSPKPTP